MYRAVNMGTGWIAVKVQPLHDIENIMDYIGNGIPVVLGDSLEKISGVVGEPVEFSSATEEYELENQLEEIIERFNQEEKQELTPTE